MKLLAILSLIPSLVSTAAVSRSAGPGGVSVGDVSYGGSGCNQGTLSIDVNGDGSICPIRTRDLFAEGGPGTTSSDQRKFCQLNFELTYPRGWSFSVLAAEYHGYAVLDNSATGWVQSTYYFSGQSDEAVSRVDFNGPVRESFSRYDAIVWDTWSPCGDTSSNLNIVQEVGIRGNGRIATTSAEGDFVNEVALKWRRC